MIKPLPKISGCFITYNEEKNIKEFIEHVSAFVDEIVIVDGGSTDNTVTIAKSMGAEVYVRPFDDYASHRNFGLMKAKYPWRFVLDLDEKISPGFKEILPKLLKSRKVDCYKCKIFHYRTEDHKLMTTGWKRILFRNYGIYWGELHERAISFREEKKIFDKNVYVEEFKTKEERYKNYLKYKKMLTDMYYKYKKAGNILLMNKLTEYLMPDHNKQMKIEIEDKKQRDLIWIDIPALKNA